MPNYPPYIRPEGMIRGGEFDDLILPAPIISGLESNVWGAYSVIPRDADNGLEDATYSYWGGNIIKGDDGKYHAFICRWPENNVQGSASGHNTWWSSIVTHAVSNNPLGPYTVLNEVGQGHNPEIYRNKDGSYIIGILGEEHYYSKTINGPWEKRITRMEKLSKYVNVTNRTYIVREDSSVYMMNKNGISFISENADEVFDQVSSNGSYNWYSGSNLEDPVVWKDEVQYHCIYNDSFGRVASYMRSADGFEWKHEKGVAYDYTAVKHDGGTNEGWYKLERPKVIQDEYGRATHLNFAAIDTIKDMDKANDIHSSKNVIVPLTLTRRLEILNTEIITSSTTEIKVKIYADDDFNPQTDIDLSSLVFGASDLVNVGKGCSATGIEASGNDAIITFNGAGNGLTSGDFAAKLLGETNSGGLIYGFAKLKRNIVATGNIQAVILPDSIPNNGHVPVQISYNTNVLSKISVRLINKETNKTLASKNHYVFKNKKATLHVPISDIDTAKNKYQWKVYLYPDDINGSTTIIDSIIKDVRVYKKAEYILTTGSWGSKNVTSSTDARWGNRGELAFDNNYENFWEPKESTNEWVKASLNSSLTIKGVKVKFLRGDTFMFDIEILGSMDGTNWETYYAGKSQLSHDFTSMFVFNETKTFKYFKVITKGCEEFPINGIYEITPIINYWKKIDVSGVSLNKDTTELKVGQNESLIATIEPADAYNKGLLWTTNNHEVATVNNTGEVTAVNTGEAVIKATTTDGGFTDSCIVRVKAIETSVESLSVQTKIYPNPFQNILNLELENEHQFETVEIFNVLGKKLFSKHIGNQTKVLISDDDINVRGKSLLIVKLMGSGFSKNALIIKQ